MKILNRLTLKHLWMNKKRTLVTIIGITLSTALMIGIGLLVSTFVRAMQEDAIKYSGSYHAYFDNVTKEEKDKLSLNINFEDTYSYGVVGYSYIANHNNYKPYLYIVSADKEFLSHEELVEGSLPQNNNEIVLPMHLIENLETPFKIGDQITLEIGPRILEGEEVLSNNIALNTDYSLDEFKSLETLRPEKTKTYTIVGFISRSKNEDYSAPGYTAMTTQEEDVYTYRLYGEYKSVRKTYDLTEEICDSLNSMATCNTNDSILYYYGVSRYSNITRSILTILVIALSLISIGSIIVIYNSFAISTMERKKSFGLYSSLGATPKQIKYTVFFEAFVVGIIGLIIGLVGSFAAIYILIEVLNYLIEDSWGMHLVFTVEPLFVIIPIFFMIVVIYLSAYLPARRASKVSPVELIRENDEIKIPKKQVKTPKWIRSIFGMEGEIALKNMKRNKRKYRITLLSLFISIVLFISFSTYLKIGLSITDINELPAYDILVNTSDESKLKEVVSLEEVDKYYLAKTTAMNFQVDNKNAYQQDFLQYTNEVSGEETHWLILIILQDQDYHALATSLGTNLDTGIMYNYMDYTHYTANTRKSYHTNIFTQNIDKITLCDSENARCEEISMKLTTEKKEAMTYLDLEEYPPKLIISESMAKSLEAVDYSTLTSSYAYIVSKDYETLYDKIDKNYSKYSSGFYYDSPKIIYKQQQNTILALKILFYGFITLIVLIGVTSVFNTIYTSIHLRKKEFAMLRSIGLSPKGFNKMLFFESFFFGIKSLFYALPVSFVLIFLINRAVNGIYEFGQMVIPWTSILVAIVGVFLLILITVLYSARKIKKENILSALREENI